MRDEAIVRLTHVIAELLAALADLISLELKNQKAFCGPGAEMLSRRPTPGRMARCRYVHQRRLGDDPNRSRASLVIA